MEVKEVSTKITAAADAMDQIIDGVVNAALAYCTESEGQIMARIFNENLGAKGESFGEYRSVFHKEFRLWYRRQVLKKDLDFTDQLFHTIYIDYEKKALMLSEKLDYRTPQLKKEFKEYKRKLNTRKQDPKVREFFDQFNTPQKEIKLEAPISHADKARHQEDQLGFKIFEQSDKEREDAIEFAQEVFLEDIKNILGL